MQNDVNAAPNSLAVFEADGRTSFAGREKAGISWRMLALFPSHRLLTDCRAGGVGGTEPSGIIPHALSEGNRKCNRHQHHLFALTIIAVWARPFSGFRSSSVVGAWFGFEKKIFNRHSLRNAFFHVQHYYRAYIGALIETELYERKKKSP